MEDINEFWNNYWYKPKEVMANEFGHNESNKELALKFAKAYTDHKLKLLGINDVVGQSEQLKAFVDWWHGLSQEELSWYEGRYVEVFLSL